ncbi:hypothetical protein ACTXT7_000778 [Hymenolepis weldensis]
MSVWPLGVLLCVSDAAKSEITGLMLIGVHLMSGITNRTAMPRGCPNDCSNRGICSQGVCDCLNGLTGKDCSITFSSVRIPSSERRALQAFMITFYVGKWDILDGSGIEDVPICSGHGEYRQGKCHCFAEWKGPECETLWSECPDPMCSSHGRCVTGECLCFDGYGGDNCQFRICSSHNCTGNGVCVGGVCRCFSGWGGEACDQRMASEFSIGGIDFPDQSQQKDASANQPSPDSFCSFNGYRDPSGGNCRCFPGFEGPTCEKDRPSSSSSKSARCLRHLGSYLALKLLSILRCFDLRTSTA